MLKIREIRKKKKLTQDEVVALSGINKRSYVDYEAENVDIPISKLQKIAKVLGVSVAVLVGEESEPNFKEVDKDYVITLLQENKALLEQKIERLKQEIEQLKKK